MAAGFFDTTKKVFTKRSSSHKAGFNHHSPKNEDTTLRTDAPPRSGGAVLGENDAGHTQILQPTRQTMQAFPGKETQSTQEGIHMSSSRTRQHSMHESRVSTKKKDDIHTKNLQPIQEHMQASPSPSKETQSAPPEIIHRSEYSSRVRQNSMHGFSVLTKEEKRLEGQLLTTQDKLNRALNTSEARMKEIRRLEEEIQRLDSVVISTVWAGKVTEKKIGDLERKVRQQDEDILNLGQKLRISEEKRSQTIKLLDERTAELKGAQAFLTTADRYSEADIIKMAESLNVEIFQVSALMAEMFVDAPILDDPVRQRQHIQGQLFDHLITKSGEIRVDPLPLQLALQALLTWWCFYEVDCFCRGSTGESLKNIYRGIYKSGESLFGRHRITAHLS
jgi:hypothetical protein